MPKPEQEQRRINQPNSADGQSVVILDASHLNVDPSSISIQSGQGNEVVSHTEEKEKNPYITSNDPFEKTGLMKRIERMDEFRGRGIQEIILDLYWGEEKRSLAGVGEEIRVKDVYTVSRLVKACHVRVRTSSEADALAWQDSHKRENFMSAFRPKRIGSLKETWKRKIDELRRQALGETEKEQRKNLRKLFRKEGNIQEVVQRLQERGFNAGRVTVGRWFEELEINIFNKITAGKLVREAERKGWINQLSPKQRRVLELRHPKKGPKRGKARSLRGVAQDLGIGTRESIRQIEERALSNLKRLKKGGDIRKRRKTKVDPVLLKAFLLQEKKVPEIAEEFGVSPGIIYSRIRKSKLTLSSKQRR